jgi:hypothetical protein
MQIEPRTESRWHGARKQNRAHLFIGARPLQSRNELLKHGEGQRIHRRAIETNLGDMV